VTDTLPCPGDQIVNAAMARALHADACRDHAAIAWVVLWDLPAYPVCIPHGRDFIRQGGQFRSVSGAELAVVTFRLSLWRAFYIARHVSKRSAVLHAINRPLISGVDMA
jgi:hypothetical protein